MIRFFPIFLLIAVATHAEDIHGLVIVKQKLTRPRITASSDVYSRGPSVELHSNLKDDPLADERARVAIYIEDQRRSTPIAASIEQRDRRFVPELLVIPAGSSVSFPNMDPIFHNVFSLSKAKSFDLGNYPKNQTRTVTFLKPGIEFVGCHLHTNMSAVIVIAPNEWCTIADRTGHFILRHVPPGRYSIVAWHKTGGTFRHQVDVIADQGASVQFFVPIDDQGSDSRLARR